MKPQPMARLPALPRDEVQYVREVSLSGSQVDHPPHLVARLGKLPRLGVQNSVQAVIIPSTAFGDGGIQDVT